MNYQKYIKPVLILLTILYNSTMIFAQESEEKGAFNPHHQIGISINHVHVFEGRDDEGNREVLALPAWAIDYTYHLSQKWAIGLHTDFIIEKFKVEKSLEGGEDKETVERSYPIAPALVGIYKLKEHWSFLLGMGGEFAKEENYLLTRAGVEYGYELPKEWEIFGTFSYDIKWNAYDSWGIGLGIAKNFGK
ncbi:hypothetical protein IRZ71_07865 [Flavobacterium sp. ANB]|uniref:hypothetical protein n=1 Tax=unclassified Flavobacterium TaxID=196869 RepID=UPI0012B6DFF6|nr:MULTISPECIES: hypothetical protein [unclassified Flavobacterium]MBF4516253.1 hypothetical protein [Flavobacterium sp. ANB]MTD69850.1 hypothetical protein [Flavobacterium sp. LC2016-13]